jgi:hypothetical protein
MCREKEDSDGKKKQAARSRQHETLSFRERPFSELIKRDRRLAELRRENADGTAEERREAAE